MAAAVKTLKYGDTILLEHTHLNGLVACDGFANDRVGVVRMDSAMTIPTVDDAVFEIQPKQMYTQWKRFVDNMKQNNMTFDPLTLEVTINDITSEGKGNMLATIEDLRDNVIKERASNLMRVEREKATVLKFGEEVQFYHVKSGQYLTMPPDRPSEGDPRGLAVLLDSATSNACWRILPRFKMHNEGERLHAGDSACILSIHDQLMIASTTNTLHDENTMELYGSKVRDGFRLSHYAPYVGDELTTDVLNGGETMRFYNKETEGYLAVPSGSDIVKCIYTPHFETSKSESLFICEYLDNKQGRLARWNDRFRLRHVSSNKLLAAGAPIEAAGDDHMRGEKSFELVLQDVTPDSYGPDAKNTFALEATYARDEYIKMQSSFRLVNHATDAYVHVEERDTGNSNNAVMVLTSRAMEQDTLVLIRVNKLELQDVNVSKACAHGLIQVVEDLEGGVLDPKDAYIRADRILTRLVLFLTSNSNDPNPLTREGVPVLNRQQQMDEHEIITTVVRLLNVCTTDVSLEVLRSEPEYEQRYRVVQLSYRFVRQTVRENPLCQINAYAHLSFLQAQLAKGLDIVAEPLMEMFRGNETLLTQLTDEQLSLFVELVGRMSGHASHMQLLSAVVSFEGEGIAHNHNRVTEKFLVEGNGDGMFPIRLNNDLGQMPEVYDDLENTGEPNWVPLSKYTMDNEDMRERCLYISSTFETLGALCVGRNKYAQETVGSSITMDVCLGILRADNISEKIKTGVLMCLQHVYIDAHPSETKAAVSYVALWKGLTKTKPAEKPDRRFDRVKSLMIGFISERKYMVSSALEHNYFILACLTVTSQLVKFGYISFKEIGNLERMLIDILDGSDDRVTETSSKGSSDRYKLNEHTMPIFKSKLICLDILKFISEVIVNQDSLHMLALLKQNYSSDGMHLAKHKGKLSYSHITSGLRAQFETAVTRSVSKLDEDKISDIVLDLVKYDHPGITVKVFGLLIDFFSKQEKMHEVASTTHLLVAKTSVQMYNEVTMMVSEMRAMITDGITEKEEKRCVEILAAFTKYADEDKLYQHVLRNVGAHLTAIRFLQLFSRDLLQSQPQHKVGCAACYQFLCSFVKGNQTNQNSVHSYVNVYVDHVGLDLRSTEFLTQLFLNNRWLVQNVSMDLVATIFQEIVSNSRPPMRYFEFLSSLMEADNRPIKRNQDFIFNLIEDNPSILDVLMIGDEGHARKLNRLTDGSMEDKDSPINAHFGLVKCLRAAAAGLNSTTEVKLQVLFPLQEVFVHFQLGDSIAGKAHIMDFFREAFLVTERDQTANLFQDGIWEFISQCTTLLAELDESKQDELELMFSICRMFAVLFERYATELHDGQQEDLLLELAEVLISVESVEGVDDEVTAIVNHVQSSIMFSSQVRNAFRNLKHSQQSGVAKKKKKGKHQQRRLLGQNDEERTIANAQSRYCQLFNIYIHTDNTDHKQKVDNKMGHRESNQFKKLVNIFMPSLEYIQKSQQARRDNLSLAVEDDDSKSDLLLRKLIEGVRIGNSIDEGQIKTHLKLLTSLALKEDEFNDKSLFQNRVHNLGGTQMVIDMISNFEDHDSVLSEVLQCGVAIFYQGNTNVQAWMARYMESGSQNLFHACHKLLQMAQSEVTDISAWWARFDEVKLSMGRNTDPATVRQVMPASGEGSHVKALLRLLQVMCENHYTSIQEYLRDQPANMQSFDLVTEIANYLFALEQAPGGVNAHNIRRYIQAFNTLTEVCEGPVRDNQTLLAATKLPATCNRLLSAEPETSALSEQEIDDLEPIVFELQSCIANTLLSLCEGCRSDFVLKEISGDLDLNVIKVLMLKGYQELMESMGLDGKLNMMTRLNRLGQVYDIDSCDACLMAFQCFTLLLAMADHVADVRIVMERWSESAMPEVGSTTMATIYAFYSSRVGSIEINDSKEIQRILFRVPDICNHLSASTKSTILWDVDRSNAQKKVDSFQHFFPYIQAEMKQMAALENSRFHLLWELRAYDRLVLQLEFLLALFINGILLSYYSLDDYTVNANSFSWDLLVGCHNDYCSGDDQIVTVGAECSAAMGIGGNASNPYLSCGEWWDSLDFTDATPGMGDDVENIVFILGLVMLGLCSISFLIYVVKNVNLVIIRGVDGKQPWWVRWLIGGQKIEQLSRGGLIGRLKLMLVSILLLALDTGMVFACTLLAASIVGVMSFPLAFAAHVFVVVQLSPDLRNVIEAVTKNGKSILLTAVLLVFVVYVYGIVGFQFYREHYVTGDFGILCKDLMQCSLTTLNGGLRKGDVGEILDDTEWSSPGAWLFQFTYLMFVLIILLNIVFGIIIDTFSELRVLKAETQADINNFCFICGVDSNTFDRFGNGFESHLVNDHNMWMYAYFYVHLMHKDPADYTGPELHVSRSIMTGSVEWFPVGQAIELLEVSAREKEASNAMQITVNKALDTASELITQTDKVRNMVEKTKGELVDKMNQTTKEISEKLGI